MYKEEGLKPWRLQENPHKKLPTYRREIQMHIAVQKFLTAGIVLSATFTFLLLVHLFIFKHKENIIFSDGTIKGCLIKDTDF